MTTPPSFAEIEVKGPDAGTFLQSQLANDVRSIDVGQWRFGSYCIPDGRVQALLMVAHVAEDGWQLLLPAEVLAVVVARLQRYRLRARCAISTRRVGVGHVTAGSIARYECAAFALTTTADEEAPMASGLWAQQLELGIPWIVGATSERFLPQMLALERLQAFSLRKGCFPGQEVIARTHFLGRVKRRLVRLLGAGQSPCPSAGSELCLQPGEPTRATVLSSAAADPWQALAVVPEDALAGSFLFGQNPEENATFVIDRDVIETISDGLLNGPYHPPFSA